MSFVGYVYWETCFRTTDIQLYVTKMNNLKIDIVAIIMVLYVHVS